MHEPIGNSQQTPVDVSRSAAEWFARLLDDGATPNDLADFRAWLQADPSHAAAYADIERLWLGAGMVPDKSGSERLSRRKLLKSGGALVVVASSALATAAYMRPLPADFRTGKGETRTVTLPDGSTAELSTASAISLTYTATQRAVTLVEGEAFFTVASESSRPFVVNAGPLKTVALGTQFSVSEEDDRIIVAVAEHSVHVSSPFEATEVQAGQSVVFANDRISKPSDTDIGSRLSWRDGKLVFISTPLEDAVHALSKWRRGKMIVMDSALARRPITLIVDVRRAGNILQTLQHGLPIRVDTYSPWLALIYPR
ncbi:MULTISPECIES: FecR family protein [unclassified Rhizobium]|uniref:FecR family protein n=1 Tax=unclassified Rhizobium TaxID=2613769 RepID=UPI001ADB3ABD|nr:MULTISPECIES: FecR family protein [unclassified Rhizobium]MBO9126620.1 FecR family protein [Rhizobium sp. 16-488-2b]MBO9177067.1 FecR family protein [Rhizobium sp. 16-488-2a]